MDTRSANSAACRDVGLSTAAAPCPASPLHSSKLKCLRRYVTDTASRAFENESSAEGRLELQKEGERARRRKRRAESSVATRGDRCEKETETRNASRLRLLHDALGEADAPPPRVATGGTGLPSSSNRRQAAASFDALQFGRVFHQQAGANVKAYSLAAGKGGLLERPHAPNDSGTDEDFFGKDEKFCDMDSDDEAVVVVDDVGRNMRVDGVQQRQIKALLKAEEQQLRQSRQEATHILSAAVDTSAQKMLISKGGVLLPDNTKEAASFLSEVNLSKAETTRVDLERARVTGSLGEMQKCGRRGSSGGAQCGELEFRISEKGGDTGGVGRRRQGDRTWAAGDTDLSPPRRRRDDRSTQGRGEADTHSDAADRSSTSGANKCNSALPSSRDSGGYGVEAARALPPSSRRDRSLVTQSWRLPDVFLSQTGAAARVTGTGIVDAHSASPESSSGKCHEISTGTSIGHAAFGEVKTSGERNPASQRVVYRDRRGRVITEEEWLELKDPVTRKYENRKKEGTLPVELAWGGGLVQKAEKAQTAAEEAILGQQPLARYELDEDFDLTLQRKQRWGDPLAELPVHRRTPQAEPSLSPAMGTDMQPEEITKRALNRAAGRPRCSFDAPKNRFGIEPGYRWDGVVRGNGYEDRRLKALNRRKLEERQKHMDNVADM